MIKINKLPKQWKDWCKSANLRPSYKRFNKKSYSHMYLKGRGRLWRVSSDWVFQCGDTYEEFDRWALCSITQAPVPKIKTDFLLTVSNLLLGHENDKK